MTFRYDKYNDPYCPDCAKHNAWIEILLVDELNNPISDMPYTLTVSGGEKRTGKTDRNGIVRETDLPPTGGRFSINAQMLADEMEKRPLRVRRNSSSQIRYDATQRNDNYRYLTIGDLCDAAPKILKWDQPELPKYHFKKQQPNGYMVIFRNERWVFEVCPFRAWSFLLHHQKDYSITNACNLSILSVLSYASFKANNDKEPNAGNYLGSIEDVFFNQLFDLSQIPQQFAKESFTPIIYDVPFSERYTDVEFIDSAKNLDTQMFYIANNKEVIVVWRGTAGKTDIFTDIKFKPVKLRQDMGIEGYVHSGFYNSFRTMDGKYKLRPKIGSKNDDENPLNLIKGLASNRKLFIAGHSLGGALALLHAIKLREYNPVLYTIGMPRVLTLSITEQLGDIIHHRHVNEDDPVPALPFEKDMNNIAFISDHDWLGYSIEIAITYIDLKHQGMASKTIDKLKADFNIKNDTFIHHGDAVHFYKQTLEKSVYKEVLASRAYVPSVSLHINIDEKLYLVSELLPDHRLKQEFFELYKLPKTASPGVTGGGDHSSRKYTNFIISKIISLVKYNGLTESAYDIRAELVNQKRLSQAKYDESSYLLDLDLMVADTLLPTLLMPEGITALKRFKYANDND
ncbi:lipase family protein [Proteus mirabilis]|uniref:lipase family protein n=1 Tax=Proteus mirabilis TaxID=584 RepID=UPI0006653612|nr:lipase family protein [Proteus mirabilis]EKW1740822.1 lipase family protein [Proteus mirabilis]MBI6305502.1 lipase family protein [Proteus mirabilis]MCE5372269.1 lipase family protein [Proteus mirabilis]MDC9730193.1 lipase family protein [Proteus mirabilis]MDF7440886.1 lipase family protein [Proteus mirabilis]